MTFYELRTCPKCGGFGSPSPRVGKRRCCAAEFETHPVPETKGAEHFPVIETDEPQAESSGADLSQPEAAETVRRAIKKAK